MKKQENLFKTEPLDTIWALTDIIDTLLDIIWRLLGIIGHHSDTIQTLLGPKTV